MRIPSSLKIGNHWVKVILDEDLRDAHELMGASKYSADKIKLDKLMPLTHQEETFLHEVLHLLLSAIVEDEMLSKNQQELVVSVLSAGLYQVIKDNPELFERSEQ
jgi:hypothetical protein